MAPVIAPLAPPPEVSCPDLVVELVPVEFVFVFEEPVKLLVDALLVLEKPVELPAEELVPLMFDVPVLELFPKRLPVVLTYL